VGNRDGVEIGVTCYEESAGEGRQSRHTAIIVQLPQAHSPVRANPRRLRRTVSESVAVGLAALPAGAELVEIVDRQLRISFYGWPEAIDIDTRVDATVAVARALSGTAG